MDTQYKVENGTSYHSDTPEEVIRILENSRNNGTRIRIFYGDNEKCWNEEYGMIGRIGRSTGNVKIPLLIQNSRSMGGGAVLDNCIVRIDISPYVTAYQKKGVSFDRFVSTDIGTVYNETKDEIYARCKNAAAGKRLAEFMNGKRWAK